MNFSTETSEQIELALEVAGVDLYFADRICKAFPGQRLGMVADFHNPYNVESQNYTFQTSTKNTKNYIITDKANFIMLMPEGQMYYFKVRTPKPDMTGWTKFDADLVSEFSYENWETAAEIENYLTAFRAGVL